MKRTLLTAVAALLLTAPSAYAKTFDLSLVGSGTRGDYYSTSGFYDFVWYGDVYVTTTSSADGVYGYGVGLVALSYVAPGLESFSYAAGDQPHTVYGQFGGGEYLAGLLPGASVTVTGGHVSSLTGSFVWDGSGSLDFVNSLVVTDRHGGQEGQPGADIWWSTGGLSEAGVTPQTTPSAPEPATWLMFVVGLAATAFTRTAPRGR